MKYERINFSEPEKKKLLPIDEQNKLHSIDHTIKYHETQLNDTITDLVTSDCRSLLLLLSSQKLSFISRDNFTNFPK